MKKQGLIGITLLCAAMALSACSSSYQSSGVEKTVQETAVSETTAESTSAAESSSAAVYEIPDGYTDGYVYGDYAKYSDPSASASLKGELIWIKGALTLLRTEKNDTSYLFIPELTTPDGEKWIVFAGTSTSSVKEQTLSYDYSSRGYCFKGVYVGLTNDGTPALIAHKGFSIREGIDYELFPGYAYEPETTEAAENTDAADPAANADTDTGNSINAADDTGAEDETEPITENNPEADHPETSGQPEPAAENVPSETAFEDSYADQVTPEFKATMDSYETFFDSYVSFMNSYSSAGNPVSMLSDYLMILAQYSDMMTQLDSVDVSSLSAADYAYYIAVLSRIEQKLLLIVY